MTADDRPAHAEDGWNPVGVPTWHDFYMVLRSVLAELPPRVRLLLSPDDDDRLADVTVRPECVVEIRTDDRRLARIRCQGPTEVIETIRDNVEDHWELTHPAELAVAYEGPAPSRLREAFVTGALVSDLPEASAPDPTVHRSGGDEAPGGSSAAGGEVSERLDDDTFEKLRQLGSSAIRPREDS